MSVDTSELTWREFAYQVFTELEPSDENDKFIDIVLWEFTAYPLGSVAYVCGQLMTFHDEWAAHRAASPSLSPDTPPTDNG